MRSNIKCTCLPCWATWYVYRSYYDKATGDSGIYHEQRLPINMADKILSIYTIKQNEAYLRREVNKIKNISEEEREIIYLELLEES